MPMAISDQHMQMIAREFNFLERVFLFDGDGGIPEIRIFTPVNEMAFAGHPVIGTGHVLFRGLLLADQNGSNLANEDQSSSITASL